MSRQTASPHRSPIVRTDQLVVKCRLGSRGTVPNPELETKGPFQT